MVQARKATYCLPEKKPQTVNPLTSTTNLNDRYNVVPPDTPTQHRRRKDSILPIALDDFFRWRPETMFKDPGHTSSTSTREPKRYDMHLDEALRLKTVSVIDDLPQRIADICDEYLTESKQELLQFNFKDLPHRQEDEKPVINEESVHQRYASIGKHCLEIASALAFKTGNGQSVFEFNLIASTYQKEARADGFLKIGTGIDKTVLSKEDRQDIALIEKHDLHHPLIWEFKSLSAGSLEVMESIPRLEGAFDWIDCEGMAIHGISCHSQDHSTNGVEAITGRPTGPDAQCTAENLINRSPKNDLKPISSVPLKPNKRIKGVHILQQGWAEAVRNDATFIVFNSGNYEIIGIRNRASRTLYLSPMIDVAKYEGYGKLHTSIILAAYRDVVSRAKQLEANPRLLSATARYESILSATEINELLLHEILDLHDVSINICPQLAEIFPIRGCRRRGGIPMPLIPDTNPPALYFETSKRLSERVYEVSLSRNSPGEDRLIYEGRLVMKFGRNDKECKELHREFEMYKLLVSESLQDYVIPVLAFFDFSHAGGKLWALLSPHGGMPLDSQTSSRSKVGTPTLRFHNHSGAFRHALAKLHEKHFVHGNVLQHHFLISEAGSISFISLAQCQQDDDSDPAWWTMREVEEDQMERWLA